jgi:hypothetical protein
MMCPAGFALRLCDGEARGDPSRRWRDVVALDEVEDGAEEAEQGVVPAQKG